MIKKEQTDKVIKENTNGEETIKLLRTYSIDHQWKIYQALIKAGLIEPDIKH